MWLLGVLHPAQEPSFRQRPRLRIHPGSFERSSLVRSLMSSPSQIEFGGYRRLGVEILILLKSVCQDVRLPLL